MTTIERIALLDLYYWESYVFDKKRLPPPGSSWQYVLAMRRESRRRWKLYTDLRDSNVGLNADGSAKIREVANA